MPSSISNSAIEQVLASSPLLIRGDVHSEQYTITTASTDGKPETPTTRELSGLTTMLGLHDNDAPATGSSSSKKDGRMEDLNSVDTITTSRLSPVSKEGSRSKAKQPTSLTKASPPIAQPTSLSQPKPQPELQMASSQLAPPLSDKLTAAEEDRKQLLMELPDALADDPAQLYSNKKSQTSLPVKVTALITRLANALHAATAAKRSTFSKNVNRATIHDVMNHVGVVLEKGEQSILEGALWTVHSLVVMKRQSDHKDAAAEWEKQFSLLSGESKVVLRESLQVLQTLCETSCRPLTVWYFGRLLNVDVVLPFSALLGRYTPAHVRKSDAALSGLLQMVKARIEQGHGSLSCDDFRKEALAILKPNAKRPRPSQKKAHDVLDELIKHSRKVVLALTVVVDGMSSDDQTVFRQSVRDLPDDQDGLTVDKAERFLCQPPLLKRLRLTQDAKEQEE